MVKHIQTILCLLPTNCLSVFDHFMELTFNGLKSELKLFTLKWRNSCSCQKWIVPRWRVSMANIYLFTVNNKNTEKSVKRFNRFYNISIVSNVDFEYLFVCWEPNEIVNSVNHRSTRLKNKKLHKKCLLIPFIKNGFQTHLILW